MNLLFALLILSANAKTPVAGPHWQCDASGVNAQNQSRTVTGEFKSTQALAEESALMVCQSEGLRGCSVGLCFDDGLGLKLSRR